MKTVAFIPYYGGPTSGPAGPEKRPEYLKRTVKSLQGFADVIWVGVSRPEDEYHVQRAGEVIAVRLSCAPLAIAYNLVKLAQDERLAQDYDCVYVTEADQVLHLRPDFFTPSGRGYLVPHRLEELGPGRAGSQRGPVFEFEGREWVTGERPPPPDTAVPTVYRPSGFVDGFGGAYWCSAEFFQAIPFHLHPTLVVETVTGIEAFNSGQPWKATHWQDCFVEHLSGHDYHCKLAGR